MSKDIRTEMKEFAYKAGAFGNEVEKEEATHELSDGSVALNSGYFTVTDSAGETRYFTVDDDVLEESLDITAIAVSIEKLRVLRTIKNCVIFFTALTAIGIAVSVICAFLI